MRLIDADALNLHQDLDGLIWDICHAPTIDPVVHGEWIYDMNTNLDPLYICSRCGQWAFAGDKGKLPNYCENCGAKMDGGE